VLDFELGGQRLAQIAELDQGERIGPNPDEMAVT
jgi:hypothetical protein